jgi:hypothetical protein
MADPENMTGEQRERFAAALRSAFPSRSALEEMLSFKLDKNLDDYAGMDGLRVVVLSLVKAATAEGWIRDLVAGAYRHVRGNESLRSFHDEYFTLVDPQDTSAAFESMVTNLGIVSLSDWAAKIRAIESQVCMVELDGATGTGFLVGPDLVLTNYHVVMSALPEARRRVQLRFDKTEPGSAGTVHRLAENWLVDLSAFSPRDLQGGGEGEPADDELDYALLRTATPVGREPAPEGRPRGWQTLSEQAPACLPDGPLVIVQHPQGEHLQFALDTKAILRAGSTRVRYRTNTQHGSSGSPCFDLRWNLVALHHSGDQSFKANWNEGIPVAAIAKLLNKRGLGPARETA